MATVIKSTLGTRQSLPIAFSFEDVSQQANQYLNEVQAQAASIVATAQQHADGVRRRAEEDGRGAAMRAAEKLLDEKVGQRMQTLLPALEKLVNELSDARQSWLRHWEHSAIRLAAKIAERVVRREIAKTPEIQLDLVREALEMAAGSPQLKIAMNPADLATLGGQVEKLVKQIAPVAQADIVAEEAISLGGCRVETRRGLIDQQIETQLQRIVAELTDENE
jgi:flagellar assembly protein FliH